MKLWLNKIWLCYKMGRLRPRIEVKIRRWLLIGAIRCVKSCFIDSNELLKQELSRLNYCVGLQKHPSVLWTYNEGVTNRFSIIHKYALLLIRYLLTHYNFYAKKDREAFKKEGLHEYFVKDISHLLKSQNHLYVPYQIIPRSVQNERIAVYTVITGFYDDVHELLWKEKGVDYILFTDNRSITSRTWDVHYIEDPISPIVLSRKVKMLPHEYLDSKYTATVYVDASVNIYGDISELVSLLLPDIYIAVTQHSTGSVKGEMSTLVKIGKCTKEEVEKQYAKYISWGFKDDLGLAECGILIRRHNEPKLITIMEDWYKEFYEGIHRDQISLLPVFYKHNFNNYAIVNGSVWNNQYCYIDGGHKK